MEDQQSNIWWLIQKETQKQTNTQTHEHTNPFCSVPTCVCTCERANYRTMRDGVCINDIDIIIANVCVRRSSLIKACKFCLFENQNLQFLRS